MPLKWYMRIANVQTSLRIFAVFICGLLNSLHIHKCCQHCCLVWILDVGMWQDSGALTSSVVSPGTRVSSTAWITKRQHPHLLLNGAGPASVAQLDARPTGDQEIAGSTPAGSTAFFRGGLIMKYFLRSFSSFR